jgi:hypothetical protein
MRARANRLSWLERTSAVGGGAQRVYSRSWTKKQLDCRPALSKADMRAEELRPFVASARAAGCSTTREIAAYLNSAGVSTLTGARWGHSQVSRAIRRMNELDRRAANGVASCGPEELRQHLVQARAAGCTSLREVAAHLNARGVLTCRGLYWQATSIKRILVRLNVE